jgi:hypothetical protein
MWSRPTTESPATFRDFERRCPDRVAFGQATIASAGLCRPFLKGKIHRDACQFVMTMSAAVLPPGSPKRALLRALRVAPWCRTVPPYGESEQAGPTHLVPFRNLRRLLVEQQ